MENQRFAEAELHFSRVAELDKTNAGVLVHRAMAKYQQNGDVEEAIKVLEEAVNVDERNEFVYETLGTLHLQKCVRKLLCVITAIVQNFLLYIFFFKYLVVHWTQR